MATVPNKKLRVGWYRYVIHDNVDINRPGIYEWEIENSGSYIGKYTNIGRPTRAYARHVLNLLNDRKAYRPQNPNGYRRIHRELIRAYLDNRTITLRILENPENDINRRERELILERGTLNG
jgi:hypothetical protein